jgi:hypothetical protein
MSVPFFLYGSRRGRKNSPRDVRDAPADILLMPDIFLMPGEKPQMFSGRHFSANCQLFP